MHVALTKAARRVRHLPGVEGCEWLWNALRPAYHALASIGGGIPVSVGGQTIRVPAEFAGGGWDGYEPETASVVAEWARDNPGGLFLDIGSHIGLFSAVALFAGQNIEAVAFDSDPASLAAAKRLCRFAPGRLRVVQGYITDEGGGGALAYAEAKTICNGGMPAYRNLDAPEASIPRNSLDDLLRHEGRSPALLKSDIEGAELLMLRGARDFIARCKPTLLLSIHHWHLPLFGHSADDVRAFLSDAGYSIKLLAVDHEEHWLCRAHFTDQ